MYIYKNKYAYIYICMYTLHITLPETKSLPLKDGWLVQMILCFRIWGFRTEGTLDIQASGPQVRCVWQRFEWHDMTGYVWKKSRKVTKKMRHKQKWIKMVVECWSVTHCICWTLCPLCFHFQKAVVSPEWRTHRIIENSQIKSTAVYIRGN